MIVLAAAVSCSAGTPDERESEEASQRSRAATPQASSNHPEIPAVPLEELIRRLSIDEERGTAARYLREMGDKRAISPLEEAFRKGTSREDKVTIASALIKLGSKDETYWNYVSGVVKEIVESDQPFPVALDPNVKSTGLSQEFIDWCRRHGVDPQKQARESYYEWPGYLMELAPTGDPRALELLRKGLSSKNYMVVFAAGSELAKVQDTESIEPIIQTCGRLPAPWAASCAELLLSFDDPRALAAAETLPKGKAFPWIRRNQAENRLKGKPLEELIRRLASEAERGPAATYLRGAGDKRAIHPLEEAFPKETSKLGKVSIASALIKLGSQDETYWEYLSKIATEVVESDQPFPGEVGLYEHNPSHLSAEFLDWCRQHGVDPQRQGWESSWEHPSYLKELALSGDPRAAPILRKGLSSRNPMVVSNSAKGLARLQDLGSIEAIIPTFRKFERRQSGVLTGSPAIRWSGVGGRVHVEQSQELLLQGGELDRKRDGFASPFELVPGDIGEHLEKPGRGGGFSRPPLG
jgi:HEAT repeat protein